MNGSHNKKGREKEWHAYESKDNKKLYGRYRGHAYTRVKCAGECTWIEENEERKNCDLDVDRKSVGFYFWRGPEL